MYFKCIFYFIVFFKMYSYPESSGAGRGPTAGELAGRVGACAAVQREKGDRRGGARVSPWRRHQAGAEWPNREGVKNGHGAPTACRRTAPECHQSAPCPMRDSASPDHRRGGANEASESINTWMFQYEFYGRSLQNTLGPSLHRPLLGYNEWTTT